MADTHPLAGLSAAQQAVSHASTACTYCPASLAQQIFSDLLQLIGTLHGLCYVQPSRHAPSTYAPLLVTALSSLHAAISHLNYTAAPGSHSSPLSPSLTDQRQTQAHPISASVTNPTACHVMHPSKSPVTIPATQRTNPVTTPATQQQINHHATNSSTAQPTPSHLLWLEKSKAVECIPLLLLSACGCLGLRWHKAKPQNVSPSDPSHVTWRLPCCNRASVLRFTG